VFFVGILDNEYSINVKSTLIFDFQWVFQLNHWLLMSQPAPVELKDSILLDSHKVSVLVACRNKYCPLICALVDEVSLQRVEIISSLDHHGVIKVVSERYADAWYHFYLLNTRYWVFILENYFCYSVKFQFLQLLLPAQVLDLSLYVLEISSLRWSVLVLVW
jgi:hypothetical protein